MTRPIGSDSNKERVEAWAARSGMTFGVAKCGVMYFGARPGTGNLGAAGPTGQRGGTLRPTWASGLIRICLWRRSWRSAHGKGSGALQAMVPFLRMTTVPLQIKLLVTRAILVPVLTYGAELFGMSLSRTMELDRILAEGLRLALGMSRASSTTSRVILFAETGIPPVSGQSARLRARAYLKYPNLRNVDCEPDSRRAGDGEDMVVGAWCRDGIRRAGTSEGNTEGNTTAGMLDRVTWQATRSLMERS